MEQQYPRLNALYARGAAAYTGAPLASLLIEVRGGHLYITGVTPLRSKGDNYVETGTEYCYILESGEAEKLLFALSQHSHEKPERIIADSFEFSRPQCLLKEYLDSLEIVYQYYVVKGEKI